jgi:crotonobetainyl-CoA:carnitine CoA-transferase CaiB-like acyl-CoA transferase
MKTGQTWVDHYAGLQATGALIAGLLRRRRTGRGQYIDVSMQEATLPMLAWHIADYNMNRRLHPPNGARRHGMVRGMYPCNGIDDWVAISIRTEEQWRAFCAVAERPDWLADPRFATPEERFAQHDDLDAAIAEWTRTRTKADVASLLQSAGIPAGPVLRADELVSDEHLRSREFFDLVDIPESTPVPIERYLAARFDGAGVGARGRAPTLGEHTDAVLRGWLGLSEEEVERLRASGAVGGRPLSLESAAAREGRKIPLEQYQELGSILRIDGDYQSRWR